MHEQLKPWKDCGKVGLKNFKELLTLKGKKAAQREIREARQQAAQQKNQLKQKLYLYLGAGFIGLLIWVLGGGLLENTKLPAPAEQTAFDQVLAAPEQKHTLTVYADFQCPNCRDEALLLERAWQIPKFSRYTTLIYRHFPLDTHAHSLTAARYAEAAGRQGKFWEMHDALFANQTLWSGLADTESIFLGYASDIGLDLEQLRIDLEDQTLSDKIFTDTRGGIKAGVRATPTLFLDGKMVIAPRTLADLQKLLSTTEGSP
jgi:protein-disulfide isomerase